MHEERQQLRMVEVVSWTCNHHDMYGGIRGNEGGKAERVAVKYRREHEKLHPVHKVTITITYDAPVKRIDY